MAAQNKKTSSRGKGGTTKKKNSSGKNNHKESQGPDLLTIVIVLIAVVLVVVLLTKFLKEKEDGEASNPTGGASVTGTQVPDAPTKTPEDEVTGTPVPTQTVTKGPEPTAAPTEAPTPTPDLRLSLEQAKEKVSGIVQLEKYSIELLDDHLMLEGAEYYTFCINDENGVSMEPLLIVEKTSGTVLCYDFSGVVATIEKFPLDKTETGTEGAKQLTTEEAKAVLAGYTGAALGLAKELSAYEMTVDDWTTMADGLECYGINLFETTDGKQRFRGTFYVVTDGSAVYSKDDVTGEFIKH